MWKYLKRNYKTFIVAIAIPLLVGLLSAFFTRGDMQIYSDIVKPPLAPPALIFPIVWTVLYILMGISSGIIYTYKDAMPVEVRRALNVYASSLVVNFAWSVVFFKIRAFFLAFIVLLFLLYLIIRTIIEYRKISPLAAYLQIPYAIWVAFAGYLNLAIVFLN